VTESPASARLLTQATPSYFFNMNSEPPAILAYWQQEQTAAWTNEICGCTIVYIASAEGTIAMHFSGWPLDANRQPITSVTPKDWAGLNMDRMVELYRQSGFTQARAVVFYADGVNEMKGVATRVEEKLKAAGIQSVRKVAYDYFKIRNKPSGQADSMIWSSAGNSPEFALFDGDRYDF
jgi:hypothetical protein